VLSWTNFTLIKNILKMRKIYSLLLVLIVLVSSNTISRAQCNAPINLAYSYANNTSTFTWDSVAGASSYEIEFKYDDPFYTWATPVYVTTSSTHSLSLVNIQNSATYQWRVRASCSNSSIGSYTESIFTVPCPAATNLVTVAVGNNTATVAWQYESNLVDTPSYSISYRILNSGNAWTNAGYITGSSFTFNGLQSNTTYEWCVNQTCGYFWSSPTISQFTTTGVTCNAPTTMNFSNQTSNSVVVGWNAIPGAISYYLQYRLGGSSWSAPILVSTNNYTITGLSPLSYYQWRVATTCNGGASIYSAIESFTTLPLPCANVPSNFIVSANSYNATINWSASAGANNYTFKYRMLGSTTWTTFSPVNTNSIALTGLWPNTGYEYQASANCTGASSSYSSIQSFTTPICAASGINTNDWIDYVKIGSIIRSSGAEPGGYINTGLSTSLTIGAVNACQISLGYTGGNGTMRNYALYIDYNNNGSFNDAGEKVAGWSGTTLSNNRNFSFTVANTVSAGTYQMRVIMQRTGNSSPCQWGFTGEVEDYTVNIVAPAANRAANIQLPVAVIYPNPSAGLFNINFDENDLPENYEVVDLMGKVIIAKQNITSKEVVIDIQNVTKGIYILRILNKQNTLSTYKLNKL
jgi:hypothetical protein